MRTLSLLLPALVPSWRFFDVIAPSPRIQVRVLAAMPHSSNDTSLAVADELTPTDEVWQPLLPLPAQVSLAQMAMRLFWNPLRNEQLFLVSCAERLLAQPQAFLEMEIARRIARHMPLPSNGAMQFRIVLITGDNAAVESNHQATPAFVSRVMAVDELP